MRRLASLPFWTRLSIMGVVALLCAGFWLLAASWILLIGTGLVRVYHYVSPTMWLVYWPHRAENARLDWWLTASALVAPVPTLLILARFLWELFLRDYVSDSLGKPIGKRPLYGETSFATQEDMQGGGFELKRRLR